MQCVGLKCEIVNFSDHTDPNLCLVETVCKNYLQVIRVVASTIRVKHPYAVIHQGQMFASKPPSATVLCVCVYVFVSGKILQTQRLV